MLLLLYVPVSARRPPPLPDHLKSVCLPLSAVRGQAHQLWNPTLFSPSLADRNQSSSHGKAQPQTQSPDLCSVPSPSLGDLTQSPVLHTTCTPDNFLLRIPSPDLAPNSRLADRLCGLHAWGQAGLAGAQQTSWAAWVTSCPRSGWSCRLSLQGRSREGRQGRGSCHVDLTVPEEDWG